LNELVYDPIKLLIVHIAIFGNVPFVAKPIVFIICES